MQLGFVSAILADQPLDLLELVAKTFGVDQSTGADIDQGGC